MHVSNIMTAVRLNIATHELSVENVPVPEPKAGEVRIAVKAAGVCLSDVHLADGTISPLFLDGDVVTLGHEVAGVIDATGPGVTRFSVGQRVVLQAGHQTAEGQVLTRGVDYDGGYADYAISVESAVIAIPDSLSFEQACIIPDAVSTPWAAISATAEIRAGESVGIWGLGGLGAHGVQLLRFAGAAPIIAIDPLEAARTRALALGADFAVAPEDLEGLLGEQAPHGLDVALDFAGVAPVRTQALASLRREGRLIVTGISGKPIETQPDFEYTFRKLQIRGHYGSGPEFVPQLVRLLELGRLDFASSVTRTFPLSQAPEAIKALEHKDGNPIRFVLLPDGA
jgi:D-arabinose 1-dehydrogenase-like Zn-dependent alcohol dehydrogenase